MKTYRSVSQGGEDALYETITKGDCKVTLVDYMGHDNLVKHVIGKDAAPVMAAREWYNPFKFAKLKFHVRAPIEDAMRLTLHPRASVNEYSGRYSEMIDDAGTRYPGYDRARRDQYEKMLDHGVSREQARTILGTDNMTELIWKISLPDLYRTQGVLPDIMKQVALATFPNSFDALAMPADGYFNEMDEHTVSRPLTRPRIPMETKRVCNEALEERMSIEKETEYGAICLLDYMGGVDDIAKAARTSYGQGTTKKRNNKGLTRALYRDLHTSPFEMVDLSYSVRAPFVIDPRQLARHRTITSQGFLDYYPKGEAYIPLVIRGQDNLNKQGSSGEVDAHHLFEEALNAETAQVWRMRRDGCTEDEVRRMKGVWRQSRVHHTGDLHNILHMIKLRDDPHAQYEAQLIARDVADFVKRASPTAWRAFEDYTQNAVRFSAPEIELLRGQLGAPLGELKSAREQKGFEAKLRKFDK